MILKKIESWFDKLEESLKNRVEPEIPRYRRATIESNTYHQIDAIRRYMNLKRKTKLLEIGCEQGEFTFHANHHCKVFGVDTSLNLIAHNPVKRKALMNPLELAFPDDAFDIVVSRHILHQVHDIHGAMEEMKRVSRRIVLIAEPNRNHPLNLLSGMVKPKIKSKLNALRISPCFLPKLAKRHGLRVLEASTYGFLIPAYTPRSALFALRMTRINQPFGYESLVVTEKPPYKS